VTYFDPSVLKIRSFGAPDWARVWPILQDIVVEQETFPYDPAMTEGEARSMWIVTPPGRTLVADRSGQVLGTANMHPNRPGPGKHIASGSFMVARAARSQGVGRALVEAALSWATDSGFAGMQFNAVVEGNLAAKKLYADLGFVTVGTVPGAFESPTRGRVGLHVLYRTVP